MVELEKVSKYLIQQDTAGDKGVKIMKHLVRAQMPFSFEQLKRLDKSIESIDVLTKGEV